MKKTVAVGATLMLALLLTLALPSAAFAADFASKGCPNNGAGQYYGGCRYFERIQNIADAQYLEEGTLETGQSVNISQPGTSNRGMGYVDANNDGICDYYPGTEQCPSFLDENGDGICDYNPGAGAGAGAGRGAGFIDENGDGVCDYYPGAGMGAGRGHGYNDANGDGICDNRGAGRGAGNGAGARAGR